VRRLAVLLTTVALVAAGCDTGSDSDDSASEQPTTTTQPAVTPPATTPPAQTAVPTQPERTYSTRQLSRLALQPTDAPRGMRYTKRESGRKTLDEIGVLLDTQTNELRRLGYRAVYDSIFDSIESDLRLASRLWLFEDVKGAERWLARTESNSLAVALQPISAPRLADDSWAAGGNLNGNDLITHAFRAGNVVVIQTLSTQSQALAPATALAAAQKAVTRVNKT
jgi:hypothetical protein